LQLLFLIAHIWLMLTFSLPQTCWPVFSLKVALSHSYLLTA